MERVQERGEECVGVMPRTTSGQRWSRGYWEQGGSGEQSLK